MFYNRFKKYVGDNALVCSGDTIVIGASGGVDSMVLIDLMSELSKKLKLELIIAHVNHMLRGKESLRDEKVVREAPALRQPVGTLWLL